MRKVAVVFILAVVVPSLVLAGLALRSLRAQRILVVEDDAHIALGLREVLSGEGFEVLPCARGDLAVDLCTRQNPDLVLLDVMLPGLSG